MICKLTIERNPDGACRENRYAVGHYEIYGYGTDDELYAVQAASTKPLEETDPTGLVLLHALCGAQNLTKTVLIHGDRHQNRNIFVLSAPVAAQIDAIHVDIRIAPALKLKEAAKKVEDGIEETLTYCDFPSEHWTRIRTNNVIERLNREIRRRTRVVGTFPDGNSALMLD